MTVFASCCVESTTFAAFEAIARDAAIGMRIVRHRADLIGAKLAIESEQGHGTTVTLLLDRRNAKCRSRNTSW
jgi:signal transduction histidine kinase